MRTVLDSSGAGLTEEETGQGEYIKPNAKFVIQVTEWEKNNVSNEHTAVSRPIPHETPKVLL